MQIEVESKNLKDRTNDTLTDRDRYESQMETNTSRHKMQSLDAHITKQH